MLYISVSVFLLTNQNRPLNNMVLTCQNFDTSSFGPLESTGFKSKYAIIWQGMTWNLKLQFNEFSKGKYLKLFFQKLQTLYMEVEVLVEGIIYYFIYLGNLQLLQLVYRIKIIDRKQNLNTNRYI